MNHPIATLVSSLLLAVAAPATADIVVVVHPDNPATRMFTDQAAQFFLGKSNVFTPVDQAPDSAIRTEFYQKVANKTPAQVAAIWSKLVFSAKAVPPRELKSDAEVKKAIAADPKGIGYIDKAAVDASVKVVLTLQ